MGTLLLLPAASCYRDDPGALRVQGWTDPERAAWYRGTQGSRLMPAAWFGALEVAGGEDRFATMANLGRFGFLAPPEGLELAPGTEGLPIGFAADRQADEDFRVTRLRWYVGQKGTESDAEAWIGLNCAACHTGQMRYGEVTTTFDGAANLLDFQSFIEELDRALIATRSDPGKMDRFAAAVLEGRHTPANRASLSAAMDSLIAWQRQTDAMNETDMRYGHGRLDAVGHILNKVLMFAGADATQGNPANAPVSYPFLWGITHQKHVQWNGIAENSRIQLPGGSLEVGALGRNTGEVLGVFGEVMLEPREGPLDGLKGYRSSVNMNNLDEMEHLLRRLEAPVWPAHFPPVDEARKAQGKELFGRMCADCHFAPPQGESDKPTERMVSFEETLGKNPTDLTDIWMACNAFVYSGPSGPLEGVKDLKGVPIEAESPVAVMLEASVRGTIIGNKAELARIAFRTFFGLHDLPEVDSLPEFREYRAEDRNRCENATRVPTLGYKARPLDGIWATAPYLHNGSVASLYELLLPPDRRAFRFWVGNREFDPVKVGYVDAEPADGNGFLLVTRDEDGVPVEGNSPAGHDYGVGRLTEDERFAIIEYLKSL